MNKNVEFFYISSLFFKISRSELYFLYRINVCVQGEVLCGEEDGHCEVPARTHHPAREEADACQCRLLFFNHQLRNIVICFCMCLLFNFLFSLLLRIFAGLFIFLVSHFYSFKASLRLLPKF